MKKSTIIINADKILAKNGSTEVFQFADGTVMVQNGNRGKTITEKELLCHTKKSLVGFSGVNKDGKLFSTIIYTPQELLKFAKNAIVAEKNWQKWAKKRGDKNCSFFKHLNPEVSFFFISKVK